MSGTLALSWGKYGGWYLHRHRICMGRLALTVIPGVEIEPLMSAYVGTWEDYADAVASGRVPGFQSEAQWHADRSEQRGTGTRSTGEARSVAVDPVGCPPGSSMSWPTCQSCGAELRTLDTYLAHLRAEKGWR